MNVVRHLCVKFDLSKDGVHYAFNEGSERISYTGLAGLVLSINYIVTKRSKFDSHPVCVYHVGVSVRFVTAVQHNEIQAKNGTAI